MKPFPINIDKEPVMVGAILCEDMWCDNYSVNPTNILVKNGAEVIVNVSSSPWTWRKNDKRHSIVRSLLERDPVPFIYGNNVGIQNNGKNIFLFDGGTTVYNSDGSIMMSAKKYQEETVDAVVGLTKTAEIKSPPSSDESDTEELYQGLIYGVRKFFKGLSEKIVIGISGGIDSAVSASL
ncbi:MAG: NAD(+) synthase, partial [Patescibacteria group bacterium]